MAEIRKFSPGTGGAIAQALAKAMGESVRPTTPGAPPELGPAHDEAVTAPVKPAPTSAASFVVGAGQTFTVSASAVASARTHATPDDQDDPGED
ncbi:hypothetical protein ACSDQ9_11980 [Aestuariimicrobium soli]|uniref:hypothetical protein n=1 Tax=Aestuariimicrobium soli TaxID=2035834 RepID=UPI003EBD280C